MSRESKSLKKSRSDWLNSGNALIQHLSENAIFVCPRFLRYAETQAIRDDTLKCLLLVTFLSKSIKISSRVLTLSQAKCGTHF